MFSFAFVNISWKDSTQTQTPPLLTIYGLSRSSQAWHFKRKRPHIHVVLIRKGRVAASLAWRAESGGNKRLVSIVCWVPHLAQDHEIVFAMPMHGPRVSWPWYRLKRGARTAEAKTVPPRPACVECSRSLVQGSALDTALSGLRCRVRKDIHSVFLVTLSARICLWSESRSCSHVRARRAHSLSAAARRRT